MQKYMSVASAKRGSPGGASMKPGVGPNIPKMSNINTVGVGPKVARPTAPTSVGVPRKKSAKARSAVAAKTAPAAPQLPATGMQKKRRGGVAPIPSVTASNQPRVGVQNRPKK